MDSTNSQHLEQSRIGETTAGPQQATFYRQSVAEQTLRAYHGDPAIKLKYVGRMRAHQEADELIRGTYWKNGKGCAVGCTVHSPEHKAYETELGMPEWFALLEDQIFEGMSQKASCRFPMRLLSAIPVGFAEWDRLYHEFCAHILSNVCRFDRTAFPDVAAAVDAIVRLHEQMTEIDDQVWSAARSAASSVARVAASSAARSAARSAAWAAEKSAESAAVSAASSAAESTWSAASSVPIVVEYDRMGDWLVSRFDAADGSR